MKKILILTADAGFGHRSAANAVAAALQETYADQCLVEIINPLDDKRTPFFLRDSQSDYDRIVRDIPEVYRIGYDASDAVVPSVLFESALVVLMFEVMQDLVKSCQPDAIVTTYPLYQAPLRAVFTINRVNIPLLTVVTDLATVHRIWFHPTVDACLVPTPAVRDLALEYGHSPNTVHLTGLPVNPQISKEKRDKAAIRHSLGWQTGLPTILAVGSRRVGNLVETLNIINHFGSPLQLVIVAGKDAELYEELKQMDWHTTVHLYEFSSELPVMMRAADALVCKAGGLIVTEALACGLPMLLVDALPGQEAGNADFVTANGAGDRTHSERETLEILAHWLMDDQALLKIRGQNAAQLGKPRAAYDVAYLAWQAAQRGPCRQTRGLAKAHKRLGELLDQFDVPWKEG